VRSISVVCTNFNTNNIMKLFFKITIIILVFIGITNSHCEAQVHVKTYSGKVVNKDGVPIQDVNIYSHEYKIGTTTDKNGEFKIKISPNATLEFSCVAFETKSIVLKEVKDHENLIITLTSSVGSLSPVTVTSEDLSKINKIRKELNFYVSDFNFSNGLIYILGTKANKKMCYVLTPAPNFDTLSVLRVSNKMKDTFKDCFGNIHLLSSDSSYQLGFKNNELKILYGTPLKKFNKILRNVLIINSDNLYTPFYKNFGQTIVYIQHNLKTKELKALCHATDEENLAIIIRELEEKHLDEVFNRQIQYIQEEEYVALTNSDIAAAEVSKKIASKLKYDYLKEYNNMFSESMMSKLFKKQYINKNLNPIFEINGKIYFISTLLNEIQVFNHKGKLIKSHKTDLVQQGNKNFEILFDEENNNVYSTYIDRNGILSVYSVDVETGKLSFVRRIDEFVFPTKVIVSNGKLYALINDNTDVQRNTKQLIWAVLEATN
jgi:hypothetical protein